MLPCTSRCSLDTAPCRGRPSSCYLVLDVLNATDSELELQYADGKSLLMESCETCRVPVPVDRCPPPADQVRGAA